MARTKTRVARRRPWLHREDKRRREGEDEPPQQPPLKRSRNERAANTARSNLIRLKELAKHISWRSSQMLSVFKDASSSSSSSQNQDAATIDQSYGESIWEKLPLELCLQIFGWVSWPHLLSCELVCRHWTICLRSWDELWAVKFRELWPDEGLLQLDEELRSDGLHWRDFFCPEVIVGGGVVPLPRPSRPCLLPELNVLFDGDDEDDLLERLEPEAKSLLHSVGQEYLVLMFKGSMQVARQEWNQQCKEGEPELQVHHIQQWVEDNRTHSRSASSPSASASSQDKQPSIWELLTNTNVHDRGLLDRLEQFHEKGWDKQPLRDVMGRTPLHIALYNAELYDNMTADVLELAMMLTAEGEGIEMREVLKVRDNEGKTPLMMVRSSNWEEGTEHSELMVEFFKDIGTKPDLFIADKRDWTVFEHVLTIMEDASNCPHYFGGEPIPDFLAGLPYARKMKIAFRLLRPHALYYDTLDIFNLLFGQEDRREARERMKEVLLWRNEEEDSKTLLHHLAELEEDEASATNQLNWLTQEVLDEEEFLSGVVNARDGNGWAPLHCAVVAENMEMVQGLLELGADVHALTEEEPKRTALDLALEQGDREMAALLQDVMSESLEAGHKEPEPEAEAEEKEKEEEEEEGLDS